VNDNKIPELERPVRPTVDEIVIVQDSNEIPLRNEAEPGEEHPSNVLMSRGDSIFHKTEVLAGEWLFALKASRCCSVKRVPV